MKEFHYLEKELQEAFCWFHAHPELSYEEYETTAKIREILTRAGIEILPLPLETGLVAVIRGENAGNNHNSITGKNSSLVQALRCDIDALPIQEETDLPYKSTTNGQMHACGHDFHITVGIGCALALQEMREELCGTVKIIFQPAEESAVGALKILETSAMEDVDVIWGIHSDPTNEVGTIGIREGYVTAAVDKFLVTISGQGCHGAHPDDGIDPIPVAAAMIQAFQTIITRNINAFHPALLSVTRVEAGNTWNVIPEKAFLEGTVRSMDEADRTLIQKRMQQITENIALAYGATAQLDWNAGSPATYNDAKMVEKVIDVATARGLAVVPEEESLGGDDFSFLEEKIPGCYIKLGTGRGPLIHQPGFQVNLKAIIPAVQFMTELLSS